MFAKLLKHEFKSTVGILGILSLAAIGAGVIGTFLMRYIINAAYEQTVNSMYAVLSMMLMLLFLALFAYLIGSEIFLIMNFYKKKFTDRGYLTFTLPVRSWQILLSSLLNILFWMIVVVIVFFGALFCMMYFGMEKTGIFDAENEIFEVYRVMYSYQSRQMIYQMISTCVSFVSGIVSMLTCVTIGSLLVKRHKLLAAIGIYYGFSVVWGVISSVITASSMGVSATLESAYIVEILFQILVAVGGFCLSAWLMDKKLNLN